MNGLDNIKEKILAAAQNDAEAILAEAQQKAQAIKDELVKQAQQESKQVQERGLIQAEESRHRLISAAELGQRNALLKRKQELIDEAFTRATAQIEQMPTVDYAAWLTRLAINNSSTGTEELVFAAADRDQLGSHVVKLANEYLAEHGKVGQLKLAAESGSFGKGLLLRQGDIEINCSLHTIINFRREELSAEVAALLFN